ncbi:LysR family transcriptional regulator [Jiangella alkaliphila]|uniref:DNA-binding transcriptional regulator, LysR family n=1 Tax=Jiangella alkaliphila TaxID=419479 RepID=A0A1H2G4E0_9ACTN|nr:LysR family transcriptional regulator [Jiangella alkaliphila]SDU14424.1 DNA-binding transcriptional regulator, LysR family [Jiangella alkaliphila]
MELEDLTAYIAVVEHNGFRRAAEALYVSQPSLTRRIARLEQELGVLLLERSRHGVKVTTQGEALLSTARRVLATVEEARAVTTGAWSHTIVVACTTTAVSTYLTDFLADWIPQHRSTRVRLIEDTPIRTRQRLMDHECDAAIASPPVPREVDSLPITRVEVKALIPSGHRLHEPGPLRVNELDREPVLVIGEHFRSTKLLRSACQMAGVQPEVIFECSAGQTIAALVAAGVGIGVLSDAVDRRSGDLLTRPLCDADGRRLAFDLAINWVRGRTLRPLVHEFVHDLSAFTRQLRES